MNKWSLIFNNSKLEEQYQMGLKHQIRKHVFVGSIAALIVIIGQDLIEQVLTSDYFHFIFDMIFLGIAFVGGMIVWKKQYMIKYALITINFVISTVQFQMDPNIEQQYNYIFGQCTMASHMIIIATSDFRQSLFQIFGLVSVRMIIMYIKTTTMNIQMYCFIIIVMLFEIYVQYISDLAQRKQFLLNIKENHWEQYLPVLIGKPFYLFHFKDNIFQLSQKNEQIPFYKLVDDFCDGCNLRALLRSCLMKTQTLEEHLIKQLEKLQKQCAFEQQIEQGSQFQFKVSQIGTFKIVYQQFIAEKIEHIVILDEFIPLALSSKQQRQSLKHFIVQQIKQFCQIIKDSQGAYDKLIKQNVNLFSLLTKNDKSIMEFDLIRMSLKMKKLLRMDNLKIYSSGSRIGIIGQKHVLFIFLFQIFSILKNLQPILQLEKTNIYIALPCNELNQFEEQIKQNNLIKHLEQKIRISYLNGLIWIALNDQIYQLSK